jgi:hypothetical protein
VLRFFHFYAKCKGMLNLWGGGVPAETAAMAGATPVRLWLLRGRFLPRGPVNQCRSEGKKRAAEPRPIATPVGKE